MTPELAGRRARWWPFSRSKAGADADALVAVVSQVSRQPGFYGEGRIADTLEGRLEAVTLHACLAFIRLRREPDFAPLAQSFADVQFRHFDAGLREAGVGDLTVPKRMRKIAGAFYGRLDAYSAAIERGDRTALTDAISRNILGKEAAPFAAILAAYAAETAAKQAHCPVNALFRLDGWSVAPE